MKAAREAWFQGQPDLDPARLVFLNETSANTAMARRYERTPRGQCCRMAVPYGHWKTTTVTAGLRATGPTALALLDGSMNRARFRAYVEQTLVPALRQGDTVILDNLPAHKVTGVRTAIQAAGARLLYLPPYSPDFTRSSRLSPSSRRCCEPLPRAPSKVYGMPSDRPSQPSGRRNAGTTSPPQDTTLTIQRDRARL